jgi:hypothetical protein
MLPPLFVVGAAELDALLRTLKAALRHADVAQEKAALFMDMDKGHLSREINGGGGLSLKRIAELPKEALQWWATELIRALELPQEIEQGVAVKKRMARMDAGVAQERSAVQ